MENNKDKGCKNRFRGKKENGDIKRELILAEPGQCYAQVTKMLGNGRLEALCFDNVKRLCHIRGKLRNRVWINTSDIILIGLRDFQDERADVILKYTAHEVKVLKKTDETLKHINITDTSAFCQDQGDDDIIFDERSGNDGKDKPKGFSFKRRENSNRNSTITKDQFLILPMEKTNN